MLVPILPDIKTKNIREYKNLLGPNIEQLRAEKVVAKNVAGTAKSSGKNVDFLRQHLSGESDD
jgi:hypothetical protein